MNNILDDEEQPLTTLTSLIKSNAKRKTALEVVLENDIEAYSKINLYGEEREIVNRAIDKMRAGASVFSPMHCFLPESEVTLFDNTVRLISEIKIGDRVKTHLGNIKKVTAIHTRKYSGPMVRCSTNNSNTAWSTPNHEYYVQQHNIGEKKAGRVKPSDKFYAQCPVCKTIIKLDGTNGKKLWTRHIKNYRDPGHINLLKEQGREITNFTGWMEADSIEPTETFLLSPRAKQEDREISIKEKALATALGYYLAEGSVSLNKVNKVTGYAEGDSLDYSFHINETEYHAEVIEAWKILGFEAKTYLRPKSNGAVIRIHGKIPPQLMFSLGGRYSHGKKMSSDVLNWPIELKKEILRTFINGDGHIYSNYEAAEFTTTSKDLAWQLYWLAVDLDLRPSLPNEQEGSDKGVLKKRKNSYIVYISKEGMKTIYPNETNGDFKFNSKKYSSEEGLWFSVKSKETQIVKDATVFNLEVEDDQSYIVEGFAVHNCRGNICPLANSCSLVQLRPSGHPQHGRAPVGENCILELTMFQEATVSYIQEYQVKAENYTEIGICTELAEIEVLLWRLTMMLREPENALLVIEQAIAADSEGNPITQQQVSPIYEQKIKLQARKSKLIKLMVGDRQEKYKKEAALKQKSGDDASSQMADLKKKLQAINIQVIDAEIITPEDLIGDD